MKLFINTVMKRIYRFNAVAEITERKKDFRFAKRKFRWPSSAPEERKSARASPTLHHTLNEERSALFTAAHSIRMAINMRFEEKFISFNRIFYC